MSRTEDRSTETRTEPGGPSSKRRRQGGAGGLLSRIVAGLRRAHETFLRNATAAAMAEEGTPELALDQLEDEAHAQEGGPAAGRPEDPDASEPDNGRQVSPGRGPPAT